MEWHRSASPEDLERLKQEAIEPMLERESYLSRERLEEAFDDSPQDNPPKPVELEFNPDVDSTPAPQTGVEIPQEPASIQPKKKRGRIAPLDLGGSAFVHGLLALGLMADGGFPAVKAEQTRGEKMEQVSPRRERKDLAEDALTKEIREEITANVEQLIETRISPERGLPTPATAEEYAHLAAETYALRLALNERNQDRRKTILDQAKVYEESLMADYRAGLQMMLDNPDLQWTGDVVLDSQTLMEGSFYTHPHVFGGEEATNYFKEAGSFEDQLRLDMVNCQFERFIPMMLADIYTTKGITEHNLGDYRVLRWKDHIAGAVQNENGQWTQIQPVLPVDEATPLGIVSLYTGEEPLVLSAGGSLAGDFLYNYGELLTGDQEYRLEQVVGDVGQVGEFLKTPVPEEPFPLRQFVNYAEGNPPVAGVSGEYESIEKRKDLLERLRECFRSQDFIKDLEGQMALGTLVGLTEATRAPELTAGSGVVTPPTWINDETVLSLFDKVLQPEVERDNMHAPNQQSEKIRNALFWVALLHPERFNALAEKQTADLGELNNQALGYTPQVDQALALKKIFQLQRQGSFRAAEWRQSSPVGSLILYPEGIFRENAKEKPVIFNGMKTFPSARLLAKALGGQAPTLEEQKAYQNIVQEFDQEVAQAMKEAMGIDIPFFPMLSVREVEQMPVELFIDALDQLRATGNAQIYWRLSVDQSAPALYAVLRRLEQLDRAEDQHDLLLSLTQESPETERSYRYRIFQSNDQLQHWLRQEIVYFLETHPEKMSLYSPWLDRYADQASDYFTLSSQQDRIALLDRLVVNGNPLAFSQLRIDDQLFLRENITNVDRLVFKEQYFSQLYYFGDKLTAEQIPNLLADGHDVYYAGDALNVLLSVLAEYHPEKANEIYKDLKEKFGD